MSRYLDIAKSLPQRLKRASGAVEAASSFDVYHNRAYLTQTASYNPSDEGDRRINGGNDYNDAIPDNAAVQQLKPDLVNGRYDYLKYFNKWGHKFRFTGENGGYYDPSDSTYRLVDGTLSDQATVYPEFAGSSWWIYDQLTGARYPNRRTGTMTWVAGMDGTQTYNFGGYIGSWLALSTEEAVKLNNNVNEQGALLNNTNRPFWTFSLSFSWTGTTQAESTASAMTYLYDQFSGGAIQRGGKTSTNVTIYFEYVENGTIPQP